MRTSEDVVNEILYKIREQVDEATWDDVVELLSELKDIAFNEGFDEGLEQAFVEIKAYEKEG
jgi:hypothetical protein